MFNVYEVVTRDNVTYTKISTHDNSTDAQKECDRLNKEIKNNSIKPICYRVMSDLQYHLLMKH